MVKRLAIFAMFVVVSAVIHQVVRHGASSLWRFLG